MDVIDKAQHAEEVYRNDEMVRARIRAQAAKLKPTGYCWNCGEPVKGALLWCDLDCREDYEFYDAHCY